MTKSVPLQRIYAPACPYSLTTSAPHFLLSSIWSLQVSFTS